MRHGKEYVEALVRIKFGENLFKTSEQNIQELRGKIDKQQTELSDKTLNKESKTNSFPNATKKNN